MDSRSSPGEAGGSAASTRAAQAAPADPVVLHKRYSVRRVIGTGSAAIVYEAVQRDNGRTVALKVLAGDMLRSGQWRVRFERETRITASLSHPNICRLHDCGTLDDGRPFYVMDLLDGEPLSARIKSRGALEQLEAVDIVIQILAALRAAHAAGVVHRDIKPENVFLHKDYDGHEIVKVLDFGVCTDVAPHLRPVEETSRITRVNMFLGSPFYMAPEQVRSAVEVDARADLWSTGVVLYEALSGQRPFKGTTLPALLVNIATEKPRALAELRPDIHADLPRIIRKALRKDRERRYGDAAAFLRDLIYVRASLVRGS